MKTHYVVVIACILFIASFTQNVQAQTTGDSSNVYSGLTLPKSDALFIIDAGDRTLEVTPSKTLANSLPPEVEAISPNLIESISVIKGYDAVDANGIHSSKVAVMVVLKEGSFEKLPADLAVRFKMKQ